MLRKRWAVTRYVSYPDPCQTMDVRGLTLFASQQSILDCSEANEGFYVKCGFKRAGLEMAHYYELK